METHLGNCIKMKLEEVGISKNEFARRINRTPQNVYSIFERESIDTNLLLEISKALDYDFFSHIKTQFKPKDIIVDHHFDTPQSSELDLIKTLKNEIQVLKKENEYLKEINALLKENRK